jgi:hypothetical protein
MKLSRMVGNKERSGTVNVQDTSVCLFYFIYFILFFIFKVSPRDLIFLKLQTPTLEFLNGDTLEEVFTYNSDLIWNSFCFVQR